MRPQVFVTRQLPSPAIDRLAEACDYQVGVERGVLDRDSLLAGVREADGLVCLLTDAVDREVIEAGTRLRVIANVAVGYNNIDVTAARERGVYVTNTPDVLTEATADLTWALILGITRRIGEGERLVRRGAWKGWTFDFMLGAEIRGKQLGIVGFGRIGRELARLAAPFELRLLAHDPYAEPAAHVPLVALDALFAESDYVSLHAPLTGETYGMVDATLLEQAKPRLILVNLGRGALVRSLDDLLAALDSGRLAAVGLDVFDPEPPDTSHPLFRHPRVLLTPHALGLSRRARERIFQEVAEGILAVFGGERPRAVANPGVYE
jgi:glyoxylate reductase